MKLEIFSARIAAFFIATLIVVCSVWQGQFNNDPHHWGLMLSNAKDLYEGRVPYKDIFIQYGILTTIIHSISYSIAGKNLKSIIEITSIAYALGLFLIFEILWELTKNLKISFLGYLLCFSFHPIVIYPWSNYVSFPFLVLGIFIIVKYGHFRKWLFVAGASFGFAILARESLAPAILLTVILSTLLDGIQKGVDLKKHLCKHSAVLIGIFLPLLIFIIYLVSCGIFHYWRLLSWDLPHIYLKFIFPDAAGFKGVVGFYNNVIGRSKNLDIRWILLAFVFSSNILLITLKLFRKDVLENRVGISLISIGSLFLISASIHIPEIFRLATGSVIGLITLLILLDTYNIATIFCIVFLSFMTLSLGSSNTGNIYFPTPEVMSSNKFIQSPPIFYGQKWPENTSQYYSSIYSDLNGLKNYKCSLIYHYNYSMDSFLQVLSPFKQYQIAPYGAWDIFNNLRPDYNFNLKIKNANDIVLFVAVPNKDLPLFQPSKGFYVYRQYITPPAVYIPPDASLLILVPLICR